MIIHSSTGIIDVTKSETGERYVIGFVKAGTRDTCLQPVILAGGSYMDSVYVLGNSQYLCAPYFNANPSLVSVCRGGGPGCLFDITGQAKSQKIVINNSTGVMDLQKTLQGGISGILPTDGQTVTTTIYYKLGDNSNYALQHIGVMFMYYTSRSQILANFLNNVLTKRINILQSVLVTNSKNPKTTCHYPYQVQLGNKGASTGVNGSIQPLNDLLCPGELYCCYWLSPFLHPFKLKSRFRSRLI